jgi:8-amino-7-oxononanoate synthase
MRRDPAAIDQALAQLEQQAQRRRRVAIEAYPVPGNGTRVRIGGRELRNFCSNDYLGLAQHPKLIEAQQAGARQFGAGSGAAHLVSGHSLLHQQLEEELAEFTGRERALLFSTGYMANLGVLAAFTQRGEVLLEDRLNHASLIDGATLSGARLVRYAHADAQAAAGRVQEFPETSLIASDGVFSMDGDVAPVRALATLATQQRAWLVIDDAHGLGVLGEHGGGVLEQAGLGAADVPLLVGTLGKAFGSFGAFVAGDAALIDYLVQRARSYIYTTALPPAIAATTSAALKLVREEAWRRERLAAHIARFRTAAAQLGFTLGSSATPIQPLLIGAAAEALALSAALRTAGFWVAAIRPPTVPAGSARLRITLSAAHDAADIDALLAALAELKPASGGGLEA